MSNPVDQANNALVGLSGETASIIAGPLAENRRLDALGAVAIGRTKSRFFRALRWAWMWRRQARWEFAQRERVEGRLREQLATAEHERDRALEQRDQADSERDATRDALEEIRAATDMALPSEQSGSEWERCVRVPIARMAAIDAALASVLGDPLVTNEPKPTLHGFETEGA